MRYYVTMPVPGGTQWYEIHDSDPNGPLGLNGVVASFSVHMADAAHWANALANGLNVPAA